MRLWDQHREQVEELRQQWIDAGITLKDDSEQGFFNLVVEAGLGLFQRDYHRVLKARLDAKLNVSDREETFQFADREVTVTVPEGYITIDGRRYNVATKEFE